MKHPELTKVERQVLDAYRAIGHPVANHPGRVCKGLRLIAHHEAAHVAARMFTGQEANHLVSVSIIPDNVSDGIARSERNRTVVMLESYPPPKIRTAGYCLLLMFLAGRASDARLEPLNPTGAKDWLSRLTGSQILDRRDEEWGRAGSDLFHALRVARIMRHPRTDKIGRVLAQAEKWTVEMLAIPEVWNTVERLAGMLLERGTLTDREEIADACDDILYLGLTLPKWHRRLVPAKPERKTMGWPTERLKMKPT